MQGLNILNYVIVNMSENSTLGCLEMNCTRSWYLYIKFTILIVSNVDACLRLYKMSTNVPVLQNILHLMLIQF